MKPLVLLAVVVTAAVSTTRAGADEPQNAIYAEAGGAGLAYSFGYERVIDPKITIRVGYSYFSLGGICGYSGCWFLHGNPTEGDNPSANLMLLPVTASWIALRHKQHALEVGGGVTFALANDMGYDRSGLAGGGYGTLFAGYRFSPTAHPGFQFRIGAMALVMAGFKMSDGDPVRYPINPSGYMSLGAAF
jgi:hypothetical protein